MNSGSVGLPELVIMLLLSLAWIVPFVAGIWALVTLYRIRADQQAILARLDALDRPVPRS